MKNNLKIIGENIRVYRMLANLTQKELEKKLGVNHQSISRWEDGEHEVKNVSIHELLQGVKAKV